jgi:hypothetical protein
MEVYVSTDVETDGPIPGPHSMLSIASVAFDVKGNELDYFTRNLEFLPGASGHHDTMAWWAEREQAWAECRTNQVSPKQALTEYVTWLATLPRTPVFVGYPAGWDFMFVYWYLIQFTGQSPFGHSALDIRSYAMAAYKRPYKATSLRDLGLRPRHMGLTHVALEDAREQGRAFMSILLERAREK